MTFHSPVKLINFHSIWFYCMPHNWAARYGYQNFKDFLFLFYVFFVLVGCLGTVTIVAVVQCAVSSFKDLLMKKFKIFDIIQKTTVFWNLVVLDNVTERENVYCYFWFCLNNIISLKLFVHNSFISTSVFLNGMWICNFL